VWSGILRPQAVQVISANRLADGVVVYRGHDSSWVERLSEAKIFSSKVQADAELLAAQGDAKRNLVVESCLVEVREDQGSLRPTTLREAIRAQGPTIDFLPRNEALTRNAKLQKEDAPKRDTAAVLRFPQRARPQALPDRAHEIAR
jgi:type IV secretory pathway ATPase VirB11/archaellum biosynthesis ATPase